MIAPTTSSAAIAIATLAQTGRRRASQKPIIIAVMSDIEFRTLSP